VGRDALQVAKLVDSHTQGEADFEVELLPAAGIMLDEEIELGAVA
jgi:hypothetical protein